MSHQSMLSQSNEGKRGAPQYIVSYSALMTIMLAFFVMLNSMASVRESGLQGAGLGLFRMTFNSFGLPGFLTGARGSTSLNAPGGKHMLAEDEKGSGKGKKNEGRLVKPERHDLSSTLIGLLKTRDEVVLPLNVRYGDAMTISERAHLKELGRLLRGSDCSVLIHATVPAGTGEPSASWYAAAGWALEIARHLIDSEGIAPDRITAVGCAAPTDELALRKHMPAPDEPTMLLVLGPAQRRLESAPAEKESLQPVYFRRSRYDSPHPESGKEK